MFRNHLKENGVGWLVLAVLTVLVLLPLLAVVIQVLFPGIFFGEKNIGDLSLLLDVFRRRLWRTALRNSVFLGLWTTVFGTVLGGALATVRAKWTFPGARLLDMAAWLLLITPSFILAQGWVMFASVNGIAKTWFGLEWVPSLLFTPAGLAFVMVLSKFPLAYLTVFAALEWKVDRFSEAARMNGASPWTVWRTIQAPLILPAYCSGAVLIFMDTIGDFGLPASIAAVFRFPTLPYSIYTALYTSPIRFDMAGVLSFYLVVLIALAMWVQMMAMRGSRFDFMTSRATRVKRQRAVGGLRVLLAACGFVVLFLALGIPFGSNLLMSVTGSAASTFSPGDLTLEHYRSLFASGSLLPVGLKNSALIAVFASVVGLIVGFFVAYVLTYSQFALKRVIDVISIVSLAVPGVVLGIGYIFIWNQKWLEPLGLNLYGTPKILVLASVANAIPVITRVITGGMAKIPRQLLLAAQIQGAGFWQRIVTVLLPLMKGTLVSAGLAAFGAGIFNLAITTILYPPNYMTLPVVINKAFEYLHFGYAAAATLTTGLLVAGVILLLELAFQSRKERLGE